ncbi:GtrA family protein [Peribacillus kribbensis]|uniref:GtrA family protein n=1 Tax=Peribacillus kribbensis TaxID=356658 RepID=UPI00047D3F19|nr:GtrA family protein [Peribacillus kribbensis]
MKISKELVRYLIIGVLTTLINIASFYILTEWLMFNYKVSTVVSWFLSVFFAYVTNKYYVFSSKTTSKSGLVKEIGNFFLFRILSLLLDFLTMLVLVELLSINDLISKVIANILVVLFNYAASRLVIFKTNEGK